MNWGQFTRSKWHSKDVFYQLANLPEDSYQFSKQPLLEGTREGGEGGTREGGEGGGEGGRRKKDLRNGTREDAGGDPSEGSMGAPPNAEATPTGHEGGEEEEDGVEQGGGGGGGHQVEIAPPKRVEMVEMEVDHVTGEEGEEGEEGEGEGEGEGGEGHGGRDDVPSHPPTALSAPPPSATEAPITQDKTGADPSLLRQAPPVISPVNSA